MKDTLEPPPCYRDFTKNARCCLQHLYLGPEWFLGSVAAWLSKRYFVYGLEYIGKLGLLGAIFLWFIPGCHDREQAEKNTLKTKHYVAWQTLNAAIGKPGNGGRTEALQDLYHDGIILDGVDLSGGAILETPLVFSKASFRSANLSDTKFTAPDFSDADLRGAFFTNAQFTSAKFVRTKIWDSHFPDVKFYWCDMASVEMGAYCLSNTTFRYCNLVGAWVGGEGGYFWGCNLANANIHFGGYDDRDWVKMRPRSLVDCNVYGLTNINEGKFFTWATNNSNSGGGAVSVAITNYAEWIGWLAKYRYVEPQVTNELVKHGLIQPDGIKKP